MTGTFGNRNAGVLAASFVIWLATSPITPAQEVSHNDLQAAWETLESRFGEFTCSGTFVSKRQGRDDASLQFEGEFTWANSGPKFFLDIRVRSTQGLQPSEAGAIYDRVTVVADGDRIARCVFSPRINPVACEIRITDTDSTDYQFPIYFFPVSPHRGHEIFLPRKVKENLHSVEIRRPGELLGGFTNKTWTFTFTFTLDSSGYWLRELRGGVDAGGSALERYVYHGSKPTEIYNKSVLPDGTVMREETIAFEKFDFGRPDLNFTFADLDAYGGARVIDTSSKQRSIFRVAKGDADISLRRLEEENKALSFSKR